MKRNVNLTILAMAGLIILAVAGGAATLVLRRSGRPSVSASTTNATGIRDYWPTQDWRSSAPEDQGLDAQTLVSMDRYIQTQVPHIYSTLVVRHGYIVFEKYYRGDADLHYEVASVTKSFTSALIGIALDKGVLRSLDQKVLDFFPEIPVAELSPHVADLTLRHILTMTAGFNWTEETPWSWPQSEDWPSYILHIPMASDPGQAFTYNTPSIHLLSVILSKASGLSTLDFANQYLFKPMGIEPSQWTTDPQGRNNGGRGLYLRARDMAKFGYLYLNNGQWDGKQLVPSSWIQDSTRKQSNGGFPEQAGYGYLWWVADVNNHATYFAAGYGGQYIYVIPDLDEVVVITSNVDQAHQANREIIGRFVIPATRNG